MPAASFPRQPTITVRMPGLAPCRPLPAARPTFTPRISIAGLVLVSPSLPKPALVARKLAVPRITAAIRPLPAAPRVLLALPAPEVHAPMVPAPLVQAAAGAAVKEEEDQPTRPDVDCPNAASLELHGLTLQEGLRVVDVSATAVPPQAGTRHPPACACRQHGSSSRLAHGPCATRRR